MDRAWTSVPQRRFVLDARADDPKHLAICSIPIWGRKANTSTTRGRRCCCAG